MTENELGVSLRLSCQRALWGTITPNIRSISVECDGLNCLCYRAYFDSQPTEENIDEMETVMAEIHADIPFKMDKGAECIWDNRPHNELELYKWLVYLRKE